MLQSQVASVTRSSRLLLAICCATNILQEESSWEKAHPCHCTAMAAAPASPGPQQRHPNKPGTIRNRAAAARSWETQGASTHTREVASAQLFGLRKPQTGSGVHLQAKTEPRPQPTKNSQPITKTHQKLSPQQAAGHRRQHLRRSGSTWRSANAFPCEFVDVCTLWCCKSRAELCSKPSCRSSQIWHSLSHCHGTANCCLGLLTAMQMCSLSMQPRFCLPLPQLASQAGWWQARAGAGQGVSRHKHSPKDVHMSSCGTGSVSGRGLA